jgi:hypothetical protein
MATVGKAAGKSIAYEALPITKVEQVVGRDWMLMYKWFDEVGYICEPEALRKKWRIPLTSFSERISEAARVKEL